MKKLIAITIASAAFFAFTATAARAKAGEPIASIPIGLEGDPGSIVAPSASNGEGNVTFTNLKPGRYTVFLPDSSTLKVPCRMAITFGREKLRASEPIAPGKMGAKAYALDSTGRKLTVVLDKPGTPITVQLLSDK